MFEIRKSLFEFTYSCKSYWLLSLSYYTKTIAKYRHVWKCQILVGIIPFIR